MEGETCCLRYSPVSRKKSNYGHLQVLRNGLLSKWPGIPS